MEDATKKQRLKPNRRLVWVIVGSFIWVIVSVVLLGIAVEQFQNDEDYGKLGLWAGGVIIGYVVVFFVLGVRRKKVKTSER